MRLTITANRKIDLRRLAGNHWNRLWVLLGLNLVALVGGGLPGLGVVWAQSGAGGPQGVTLNRSLDGMMTAALRLVPMFMEKVETPLLGYFLEWAQILAAIVLLVSLLRLLREQEGADLSLGYWFIRAVVFSALLLVSNQVLDFLSDFGRAIAYGSGSQLSLLENVRRDEEIRFITTYEKFVTAATTMRIGPDQEVIGVIRWDESTLKNLVKDPSRYFDLSLTNVPLMFALLNGCRFLMESANIFLILLTSFVLIAYHLLSPFMAAIGIDRQLAQKATYPFAWSALVLNVVTPSVTQCISILGYSIGNIALSFWDSSKPELFVWNQATLSAAAAPGISPNHAVYCVILCCVAMVLASLMLFFSPIISYRIINGQAFEAVYSAGSSWMMTLVDISIGH